MQVDLEYSNEKNCYVSFTATQMKGSPCLGVIRPDDGNQDASELGRQLLIGEWPGRDIHGIAWNDGAWYVSYT
jgi:hypothetical protein